MTKLISRQGRELSFLELAIIQAVIAIAFGWLLVDQFPKVPLISACFMSICFALLVTLVPRAAIRWLRYENAVPKKIIQRPLVYMSHPFDMLFGRVSLPPESEDNPD
jgi:hypothetical protein